MLDCVIKVLSLYARLLTFNLDKTGSASRIQHISLGNNQQSRLPYEKKIFLVIPAIHIMGFLVTHIIRERNAVEMVPQPDKLAYERSKLLQ